MFYFNTLPKIITPDENGNSILLTNLVTRARLIEQLQNNPMLFYEYAIQDGDTPEIIAEKYYGDPFRYWIILLSNEIFDPLWDWPLSDQMFLQYIDTKYATEAEDAGQTPFEYTNTTIYKYEKIITTTNSVSGDENVVKVSITQTQYNALSPSSTTFSLPDGTCTIDITKEQITIFDYESDLNQSRRQIKILNNSYVDEMERVFKDVMGS
jgi:hypothetical protein